MKIEKNNIKILNSQKGVTIVALTITIIVLLILATIIINAGRETIREAKLEALKTNMLLIQAKAKECVEEANFKLGPNNVNQADLGTIRTTVYEGQGLKKVGEVTEEEANLGNIPNGDNVYMVTNTTLENWGLNKIETKEKEAYFVEFDEQNVSVEVYNNLGFDGKYKLSDIEKIEL